MKNKNTYIDFTQMTQEEIIAHATRIQQENLDFRRQEEQRQEEMALKEEYKKEKRAIPIRNTLVLRRTPNHEKVAPARDVLDYRNIYDLKDPLTPEGKKTKVTDEEIKIYQMLRTEGVKDITAELLAERVKLESKVESANEAEEEENASEIEEQD